MPGEVDSKLTGCEAPVGWPSVHLRSPGHVGPDSISPSSACTWWHHWSALRCTHLPIGEGHLPWGLPPILQGLRVLCLGPAPSVALAEALGRSPSQVERLEDAGAHEAPRALLTW